jgi:Protein of unknown function (DUF2752)
MTSRKFYFLLLTACITGYAWLGINIGKQSSGGSAVPEVCLFKRMTDIPCPSCGSTRSVTHLLNGDFSSAFMVNPMGMLISLILLIGPLWMAYDLVLHRQSLWTFYGEMEKIIRKKSVAIPLILLVTANWAWNIFKGL